MLTEVSLVLFCVAIKKLPRRQRMGIRSLDGLLVLAALRLLLRSGLLLRLVQRASGVLRRNDSREFHSTVDGL